MAPLCACASLMAKWTCAFGAQLGPSHASRCPPSEFLPPKLRKLDAVLITLKPMPRPLRRLWRPVSAPIPRISPFLQPHNTAARSTADAVAAKRYAPRRTAATA